jgi:hypothetical protein
MLEKHSWTTWIAPLVVLPFYPIAIIMNEPVAFAARQKFRFDLGQSFLTILNFCLVCVAASPTIATTLGVSPRRVVAFLVPVAIICVWLLGYCLDRARFWHHYQDEQNQRNELLQHLKNK